MAHYKAGTLLQREKEELGIRFSHNRFGDIIFMLDGPGIIHPSFFDRSEMGPKGMHGYLPDVQQNMTQVIIYDGSDKAADLGRIELTGVHELLQKLI